MVANASDDTDAVNLSQLKQVSEDVNTHSLFFEGDAGGNVGVSHDKTVFVKGGATNSSDLTDGNIGIVSSRDSDGNVTLSVRLFKGIFITICAGTKRL